MRFGGREMIDERLDMKKMILIDKYIKKRDTFVLKKKLPTSEYRTINRMYMRYSVVDIKKLYAILKNDTIKNRQNGTNNINNDSHSISDTLLT